LEMIDPIPANYTTLPEAVARLSAGIADREILLEKNRERFSAVLGFRPLLNENNKAAELAWAKRQLAVWKLYDVLRDDALKAFVRDPASGMMFHLEPGDWRGAAFWENIIRCGIIRSSACEGIERHHGGRVLIEKASLDRWLASEKPRQPAAGSDCRSWLEREMRANPDQTTKPKLEWSLDAKRKYGISRREFDRVWQSAIQRTGARWNLAGRKSARKSAR
jgi:hypothetical protein